MEQVRKRSLEVTLGLLLAFALLMSVVLIYESFSGNFSSDIVVSASISQAGDALEQGDIVTYHDIIVGEVTQANGNLSGGSVVKLKIHVDQAKAIPKSVTAIAIPQSLFGATEITLMPGADTSGPALHAGDHIAADLSPSAESLQTALSNAYTLLTSVHPAQLDAALTALATALEGQGKNLGHLVDQADTYLRRLIPQLPQLDTVLTSFSTVTRELARNSPALLQSVANLITVSKGVLANQKAFSQLLTVAPTAVANAQLLLNTNNVNHAVTIINDQVPVLSAIGNNPQALPDTINGFKVFADTFATAMTSGPFVKVNVVLSGANIAALGPVAVGQKGELFKSISDPPRYTSADCPRYAGASGPNCGGGASVNDAAVVPLMGGTVSSVGSGQEVATVQAAASLLTHQTVDRFPGFIDLLLGPLLRGSATVIR
jgi:virulence factor Mce-like protein